MEPSDSSRTLNEVSVVKYLPAHSLRESFCSFGEDVNARLRWMCNGERGGSLMNLPNPHDQLILVLSPFARRCLNCIRNDMWGCETYLLWLRLSVIVWNAKRVCHYHPNLWCGCSRLWSFSTSSEGWDGGHISFTLIRTPPQTSA